MHFFPAARFLWRVFLCIFAGMKQLGWIWIAVMLAVTACTRSDDDLETRFIASPTTVASPELSAIDSLMWQQPDSALALLLPYFDTCCRDAKFCVSTTTAYNRHYAHLLLAELLYKNDYAQTNRLELLQALHYFDSLCCRDVSRNVSNRHNTNHGDVSGNVSTIVFLDARAHYINGVGYYERDSEVEACKEYLKALEVMEEHFKEKELVGKKAKFMTYTYNRLTGLFSAQYMMDPAIACGERALMFCRIEPTSSTAISNILLYLGKQYDKKDEIEKARRYYVQALEELTSTDNLVYRDIVSSKALCDYQMGKGLIQSIETLRGVLRQVEDESECLTRYLTIGTIFYKEGMYDSALFYLEPIMDNKEDKRLRMDAAEQLRVIYEHLGNVEKSEECMRYIALHNEPAAEDKALVSKLEDMFKAYTDRKQEKETEKARKKAVKKAVGIIIPVAIVVALVIIVLAKLRSKQLLRNKEKRHQKELEAKEAKTREELAERDKRHVEALEAERHAHYMKQSSLSGRLKRSNEEVRELKDQIKWQDDAAAKNKTVASFTEEPICRLILERVKEGRFKSKMNYAVYKNYALNKQQLLDLRLAANRHFKQFTIRIKKSYPELTNSDLDYCCLYLLGLTDADIAALMQRAYNTVVERDGKLKRILGNDNPLPFTLMGIAKS